jgi:hypothetical protein
MSPVRSELGYDLLAAFVAVSSAASVAVSSAALVFAATSKKEWSMTHTSKIQNLGTQQHEKDNSIPSNRSNCCS